MIYMKNQCQRKKGVEGRDEGKEVKADQICKHTERVAKIGRYRESERCGIRNSEKQTDRQTDRQTDTQTDRQTDTQTDSQIH